MIDFIGFNNSKTKVNFYVREKNSSLEEVLKQLRVVSNLYNSKRGIDDKILKIEGNSNIIRINNYKYKDLLEETEKGYRDYNRENEERFKRMGEEIK